MNKLKYLQSEYIPYLLCLLVIVFIFSGCKFDNSKDKATLDKEFVTLNDSIEALVVKGDTVSLKKALELSDIAINNAKNKMSHTYALQSKVMVLTSLGKVREAFLLQNELVNKDPDSIDRLIYNGVAEFNKNHEESSKGYFEKAISLCNKQLTLKPDDSEVFISKIGIYVFLSDRDKATSEIESWIELHPNDSFVLTLKENLDDVFIQTQKMKREMQASN